MQTEKYNDKYRQDVQYVCLKTGPDEAPYDERVGTYILNCYCNYYIDWEKNNCFVLTDNDKAVGYVLCAPYYKKYRQKSADYIKTAKKYAGKDRNEIRAEQFALRLFSKKYPAHLHIDILEQYTGKGSGTALMKTLLGHLKNTGVKGVMLIVGSGNKEAQRFYSRLGFKTKINAFGAKVMTMKL